jgi:hypothetical protein
MQGREAAGTGVPLTLLLLTLPTLAGKQPGNQRAARGGVNHRVQVVLPMMIGEAAVLALSKMPALSKISG